MLIDITVLLLGYIALADCALEGIITKPFNSHTKQPAQAVQTHSSWKSGVGRWGWLHYVAWQRYWGTFIALVGAWGFAEREIAGKMYFHHTIFPPPLQGLHHTFLSRFHNFLVEGFTILTDHLVATQKSDGNTVQPPANGDPKKLLINKKLLIENLPVCDEQFFFSRGGN